MSNFDRKEFYCKNENCIAVMLGHPCTLSCIESPCFTNSVRERRIGELLGEILSRLHQLCELIENSHV